MGNKNNPDGTQCACCAAQRSDGPEMPDALSVKIREAQKLRARTKTFTSEVDAHSADASALTA